MKTSSGFTLIETILYIGLLAIVIVFLVAFFQQSIVLNAKVSDRQDNLDNAQYALERLDWYLQNSLEVKEPLAGQSSDQLVVNSLVTAQNPVKFFVADKMLKMQIADGEPQNLTNSRTQVQEISFTNQGFSNQPPLIQIKLTVLSQASLWQTQPLTLQTSVKLEK